MISTTTQTTLGLRESSEHTKTFDIGSYATQTQTRAGSGPCKVYNFGSYVPAEALPASVRCITEVVAESEQNEIRRRYLEKARAKLAKELAPSVATIRSLRLGKGWSQTKFAELLETSQPHIARIERGTENVSIQTCRKMAGALGVDMNTLDAALREQERIFAERDPRDA